MVHTPPETEQAILQALGAAGDQPPELNHPNPPLEPCAPAPEHVWGWAVQLYALRSEESWGVGDLADLRAFGRWSRKAGASVILLNPLGAQSPTLPYQPSPYYTSSRRFRNVIYLRVEDVEGAFSADISAEREAAQRLNSERIIDYDRIFELKTSALEKVHRAAPSPSGFDAYVRREGTALRDFAVFNTTREHRRLQGDDPLAFQMWLQFHLDRQLSRASREIGLITDVPVGFASDGFDASRWHRYLAPRMRVGAPPDEFFRDGQDWGIPAFDPWKLAGARWQPFVDPIRAAGRHAVGIRLDHVMSLFRLFWIPEGMAPAQGAYVQYPAPDLLARLSSVSRRAGAFVIGEDLGLVEPSVRSHLQEMGSLSYRLVWFEESEPADWPHDVVAAVGTHDLPTVAGIWTRSEPEHRLHHLREKLVRLTHLPDETAPIDVVVDVYRRLANARPRIVLVSLEDALVVHERPNVPGTTHEFPNWRRALPLTVNEIAQADGTRRLVSVMEEAGRSASQQPRR